MGGEPCYKFYIGAQEFWGADTLTHCWLTILQNVRIRDGKFDSPGSTAALGPAVSGGARQYNWYCSKSPLRNVIKKGLATTAHHLLHATTGQLSLQSLALMQMILLCAVHRSPIAQAATFSSRSCSCCTVSPVHLRGKDAKQFNNPSLAVVGGASLLSSSSRKPPPAPSLPCDPQVHYTLKDTGQVHLYSPSQVSLL